MNWLPWAQLFGSVLGSVNPAAGALLPTIFSGITTLQADTAEFRALNDQWFQFCTDMIAHGGPPTDAERAMARAFADEVHAFNQAQ